MKEREEQIDLPPPGKITLKNPSLTKVKLSANRKMSFIKVLKAGGTRI